MDLKDRYWDFLLLRKEISSSLPLLKIKDNPKYWSRDPTIKIIIQKLNAASSVLDIGAGDKRLKNILEDVFQKELNNYHSLDVDEKYKHNYRDINEVKKEFDAIFLLEFLEHLYFEDGIKILEKSYSLLKPGGHIFVSTPNVDHINQLWRGDVTHVQQWPRRDLCAILKLIGFKAVEGYRIYLNPDKKNFKRKMKYFLQKILYRILDIDYAHGIFFTGQK